MTEAEFAALESVMNVRGISWNCKVCTRFRKELFGRMIEAENEMKRLQEDMNELRDALGARIQALEKAAAENVRPDPNVTSGTNVSPSIAEAVRKSVDDMLDRKFNVIIRDLSECSEESTPEDRKSKDIQRIARALQIDPKNVTNAFRAGRKRDDPLNPRIVVVRLRTPEIRDDVLNRGKRQQGLRIGPDLTREEREADKEFFEKLEKKKEEEHGRVFRVGGPPGRRWIADQSGKKIKL